MVSLSKAADLPQASDFKERQRLRGEESLAGTYQSWEWVKIPPMKHGEIGDGEHGIVLPMEE